MRADLEIIHNWIEPDSRVLDIGCGNGELLQLLQQTKNVTGYGLEINPDNITSCIEKGINVIEKDIDNGLASIKSDSGPRKHSDRPIYSILSCAWNSP